MELEDLTDDEDFRELVNLYLHPRLPRKFRSRKNYFIYFDEQEFRERFRLSKPIVEMLVEKLAPALASTTKRNKALSPANKVLLTLRFLATGSILQVVADFCGIDKSTASRTINQCLIVIAQLRPQFVKMPQTEQELNGVRQDFYNLSRFPRCIGAVDCTHIRIQSPGGDEAEIYRNRKGYFSMNVQAVCNANLIINDIVVRWPGFTADATIFNNSNIKRQLENGVFGPDSLFVGDSGYGVKTYLMTPINNPVTHAEQLYNEAQIRTRNPIERAFGVLKRRFPILALGIRLNLHKVEQVVVASVVLHNIATHMRDVIPPINEEVEAAINFWQHIDEGVTINEEGYLVNQMGQRLRDNEIVRTGLIMDYFQNLA